MFRNGSPFGFSGGPFGFAPSRRRGLLAKVGSFNSPTSIGAQEVTGIGFRPKLFLPFTVYQTVNGSANGMSISAGATDGSNRFAVGMRSGHGLATTSANRHQVANRCLEHRVSSSGNPELSVDLTSFIDDGSLLDWTLVNVSARIVNGIWLGGDIEAKVSQHQIIAANATDSFAHGIGGTPDAIIFFNTGATAPPPSFTTAGLFGCGVWTPDSQWCSSGYVGNGLTTPTTTGASRRFETTGCVEFITTDNRRRMAITSVDSTHFHVNYPVVNSSGDIYFWAVAIRGCRATSGYFNANNSLDPMVLPCPGIRPKLFIASAIVSAPGQYKTLQLGFGASDGTNTRSVAVSDANNAAATVAVRRQDNSEIVSNTSNGGLQFSGQVSFGDESVTLDPTTLIAPADGKGGYLILGDAA